MLPDQDLDQSIEDSQYSSTVTQDSARIPRVPPTKKLRPRIRIDSRPHIPDPRRSGFTLCGKVIIGPSDSEKVWCWRCAAETGVCHAVSNSRRVRLHYSEEVTPPEVVVADTLLQRVLAHPA